MKKAINNSQNDDMLPEYNFDGKKGVRGKYAKAMQKGYSTRILHKESMMKNFIFLTDEGNTFQPDTEDGESVEVEKLQVIGIASGIDSDEAYKNLLMENSYLADTTFETIFCYEPCEGYEQARKNYNLNLTAM